MEKFLSTDFCGSGPFVAWQVALPTKAIHVKAADNNASVAAAGSAAAGATGHFPPPTPLQTPPYSALRTPRTPVLLDAFGKGDSTITHFAPPESKLVADHTLKTLGLAFNMYETFLGCKFPYKALQTVRRIKGSFVVPDLTAQLVLYPVLHVCTLPVLCYLESSSRACM